MIKPTTYKHWGIAALAIALIIWSGDAPLNASSQEQVVQIRLTNRHVGEILPLTKPLVSPGGFISADQRTNSLIVIDNPAAIERIRHLVQKLDQEVPLLKIRIQYANLNSEGENEAGASARVKAGNATAEIGKDPVRGEGEGVEANASAGQTRRQHQSEYVLRVRSGSIAYIEVGYDVPHRKRWQQLSHRYGYIPETVVFQRVASGYSVRPVLVENQVQIGITPQINYFDNRGRNQKINFAQAATTLFAPLDQWVDISSVMGGHREINRQILSDGRHTADHRLTMRLMVSID